MGNRVEFQSELEKILGSRNVYFQPPATVQMNYPAIVYELNNIKSIKANNQNYKNNKCYSVTLIHKNPDNDIVEKLVDFPFSRLNRTFSSNNLHHYVFEIYY